MADLLNTLIELRPEYIESVFEELTSDLTDIEFKFLPYKEVNRNYVDIGFFNFYHKPMSAALPETPYVVTNYPITGEIKRVRGFHFKEGIPITVTEMQELHQADPKYRKFFMIEKLDWLKTRAVIRMKQTIWDALRGVIDISENGLVYHYEYSITAGSVTSSWANPQTDIISSIYSNVELLDDTVAKPRYLVLNSKTYRYFKTNEKINTLLATAGYLRKNDGIKELISDIGLDIVIIDDFYIDSNGNKVKFVKDDEVFIIGEGNYPLGNLISLVDENTVTLDKPGRPGFWTQVIEKTNDNPRKIDIVAGITFFPAIYHPDWVVHIADVTP
ncbi:MAG: hypothetical protein NC901_03180 [Candidatus Omnitrophica bacterium]|nr:hypothetical protein [Candidatus Omnitrophota bacterium]